MANKIILKRGADANVSSLTPNSVGEPVFGTTDNKFYVASGTSAGNFEWVGAPIQDDDNFSSASNKKLATSESIKAYVDAQVTAQDFDFTTDSGSGSVDLDSQALAFTSGEGVDITHSGQAVTIAGELATTSNVGMASFASADFDVSGGGEVTINSIGNSQIDNANVNFTDGSTSSSVALGGTLTIQGTTNEVTVAQSGGTYTVGLPDDVTIAGNLVVNGNTTTATSTEVAIGDVNIKLAQANTANSADIGMYGKYVESSTTKYKGFFMDVDNSDTFTFFKGSQTEPSSTVDTSATGYTLATIKCGAIDGATLDGGTF